MPILDPTHLARTYCNPLPLPDYPRGRLAADKTADHGWVHRRRRDYRETADPSVLFHDGRWYLYPSCGMAFVSEDFVTWRHHRIEPYDCGYAPTIAAFRDRFYLTANRAPLFVADHPLGPFSSMGTMKNIDGTDLRGWADPMLFADDDGALYAYWGIGGPGIYAARLDGGHPTRLLTAPRIMFGFHPDHLWERLGDANEDAGKSFVEGPWMLKHGGRYFLTYAAPGTQYKTYAMGVYTARHPLGPFRYQKRNPILRDTQGLVHGPGHGCLVRGPRHTLWAFYTHLVRSQHRFERRIGMDPAGIDADGHLFVNGASERPQWAPGVKDRPETGNDAGLLPVSINKPVWSSTEIPGREPAYAVDNAMHTWWQAAPDDREPLLAINLCGMFTVCAMRILWAEPGLDYDNGVLPGPFRYRLEISEDRKTWKTALDRRDNAMDLLIDYQVFAPCRAGFVRLVVIDGPRGMGVGVTSVTIFGTQDI